MRTARYTLLYEATNDGGTPSRFPIQLNARPTPPFYMNSLRSLLNVALVLVLVCVALVLVARQSGGAASDTESAPTTQWYTCGGRDSLPHEYIWTATVSEEPTEAADMRCLLVGQSVRL